MDDTQAGKLIRRLRRENKLTMVNFAKQIGLSQPSLSRIESGNQEITFSLLERICTALNISMGDFLYALEGESKLQNIELTEEDDVDTEEELDAILNKMISSLSFEQKKGLYTLLLPYLKD
ncbi:helix-turn-helix domain-containing protein [Bacillus kwashiorkori]|uniref:helix-turn-helix domain-containing protein n=1 Tax=Bacillus kwashiorkori TaxID=1522318 RepID=UPI0007830762|nr:helix-turn-helix transcriptional regulator [Bacillus kwashiorkori]